MTVIFLTKSGNTLIAEGVTEMETLAKIKDGTEVKADVKIPRSIKQHRLLFAVLRKCIEYQNEAIFLDETVLLRTLKYVLGYTEPVLNAKGQTIGYAPMSIAFDKMDGTQFRTFVDKVLDWVFAEVLPNMDRTDFERELCQILGMNYFDGR